jgi:hypothetical protein
MTSKIRIDHGLVAVASLMSDDEPGAVSALSDMTPEELHELMRVLLLTTGLARESIVARVGSLAEAHRMVEALSHPEGESNA